MAKRLGVFNEKAVCPKCGGTDISTYFGKDCSYGDICRDTTPYTTKAHLHRTCTRCHYEWLEAPLDARSKERGTWTHVEVAGTVTTETDSSVRPLPVDEIKDMVAALQTRMFECWSYHRAKYANGFGGEPEQRLYDALCAFQDANRTPTKKP